MNDVDLPIDSEDNCSSTKSSEDGNHDSFPYYLPLVQFFLRLLGIYLAAAGGSYVLQNVVELSLTESSLYRVTLISALVGNAAYMAFGIYLAMSGRWIIEKIFLPPCSSPSQSD